MQPESLELELKSQIPISPSILQKLKTNSTNVFGNASCDAEFLGGVIRSGQLAWFAIRSNIEIFSLKTGQRVAGQSFDGKSVVTCVAEVTENEINSCLLIIAVQRSPVGGLLYLFSVQGSRIVHHIDVIDKITSCCFICDAACKRGNLKAFNGCAAVGTEAGEVFLIDLNLNRCKEIISRQIPYNQHSDDSMCKILCAPIDPDEVRFHVKKSRTENINLGIRLDISAIEQPSAITSILSMPQMQMIVVGFESGILALFNLSDLNALHLAYPPENDSPLMKLTFLEPADDPRPCVYIWAFHANESSFPFAVMHAVSFSSKTYQDGENVYETFQWCRADLTIPIYEKKSVPISCQSVTKIITEEEDEQYSLCLLAWTNRVSSFVLVFDLNQWYKEQMPRVCDWRAYPSYLAPFPIPIADAPLDIWLNPKSVVTFNSIQRPEEHFYPTSLSFDLVEVTGTGIHKLHWAGLQNNAIKRLSSTGAIAILVPDECFMDFLEATLIPQLSDQNYHANPTKKMKQQFLLSMALEYNCMGLLRECAQHWADGSHMGRGSTDALTLSTLTDWIWTQATLIKDRCNGLCMSLFDDSGITIDLRSRKILAHYSRQLKLLADLLHMIIANYRQYIPDEIFDNLTAQRNSIRMTSEYQEVLQWLLNMELLPEIVWNQTTLPEMKNDTITATPYPYRILNDFYTEQRQRFYDIDRNNIASKTNSCRCLYIDSFIDRECNSHLLRNEWSNGLGDGLYPPPSLQAMLRILLIPGISLENKYMLFVYLFLDLHNFLEGEHFDVVQNLIKFPAVFKLNSSLIKTAQAFWNLDHNEYEIALRELISPLTSDRFITQWQQELLVNTLLIRDMPHLALQAVRAPGPSINTSLRIKTLLANDLITEAFELQRAKSDENLLIEFFKGCHEQKKWNHVLHLALTEREGEILCKFLQTCDSLLSENLQLLYLLQRNKYIEAITYLDETRHKPRTMLMQRKLENTQDLIMSSYKLTMSSTNRTLCDQYMSIKNRLQADVQQNGTVPKPLSSELNPVMVDANANVVGSVFHRAMISAKKTGFTTTSNKNYIPLLGSIRIQIDSDECAEQKPISEPIQYVGMLKRRKETTYENHTDPDAKQPAAKRQRVDSFSMADVEPKKHAPGINNYLFTSLTNQSPIVGKKMQIQNDNDDDDGGDMNESNAMDTNQSQRNSLGELCDTVNLLSTPVVKSSRLEKHSRIDSRCNTPQSILKQRQTEIGSTMSRRSVSPSLTSVHSAKRSVDFNAKSFCYTIPSQNDEYRLDAIQETIDLREKEDDDDSSSVHTMGSIKGRRPIHSGKDSSGSNSVDEFYSPEISKVQDDSSVQDVAQNEILHVMPQSHVQTPTTSFTISPRRKLRSKTPEVAVMSSTRMTRSRSKLNLDETAEQENSTKQPVLNTSTPKRITPRYSPNRFLNKNVITSNALKVQSEAEQSQKKISELQDTHESDDNDLVDAAVEPRQRHLLKDASELSLRHRSLYVMDSADEADATQPKRNLLQDSSAFATSVYSITSSESRLSMRIDASMDISTKSTNEISEQVIQEEKSVNETTAKTDIEESVETEKNTVQQSPLEAHVEMENVEMMPMSTEPSVENTNPVVEDTKFTETTVTEETNVTETEKLPTNYLIDSSNVASDSVVQKFNRYEHNTSSFFSESQRPQENLLEDSSRYGPSFLPESKSNQNNEDDIVNVEDLDSKSGQSEKHSISSDSENGSENELEGGLMYDESDSAADEENASSEEAEEEEEEKDDEEKDEEEEEEEEDVEVQVDDEVIELSSSSEVDVESNKSDDDFGTTTTQDNYNIYDDLKYDLNDELGIPTTSQSQTNDFENAADYNIAELQPIPLDIATTDDANARNLITQEQAMNEMIYSDLNVADAEMLDLDVQAFGFEMHSETEKILGQGMHTNIVEIPETVSQQLILDDATNTGTIQQSDNIAVPTEENIIIQPAGDGTENAKSRDVNVTSNAQETINECVEGSNETINIQGQKESNEVSETNVLESAMIIDETPKITEPESQLENDINDPMQVTDLETEPTNVFENAIVASTLDVDQTEDVDMSAENTESNIDTKEDMGQHSETSKTEMISDKNITENTEKTVEEGSEKKIHCTHQGPLKESERMVETAPEMESKVELVETKSEQKQMDKVPEVTDAFKSNEPTSTDAKPQQPPTSQRSDEILKQEKAVKDFTIKLNRSEIEQLQTAQKELTQPSSVEPSNMTSKDTDHSTSDKREFTIKLDRSEVEQFQAAQKESLPSALSSKPARTKRAASEQKEIIVEPKKTEDEQPLTDVKDSSSQQTMEPIRKKRGNSQQKELPIKAKLDDKPTSSQAITIPKRPRTKSTTDSELGEKFDAEESVPSRRLRKAVSHQSLSDIAENVNEATTPKKSKTPRKSAPRRAVSYQSLSSASDSDGKLAEAPAKRVTRSKSIQSIQSIESDAASSSRRKRATSKQRLDNIDSQSETKTLRRKKVDSESSESELGDKFDADESTRSRRMRKAISHQTLSKIDESAHEESISKPEKSTVKKDPSTPIELRTRRAASHQSLSSAVDSESSDKLLSIEDAGSTSSRSRAPKQTKSPPNEKQQQKATKRLRSTKKDDNASDTSSVISTRSRKASIDDDSSAKSSKIRSTRSASVLPPIPEVIEKAKSILPAEYLETSRLTRSQRATIEKYSKLKEKVADIETTTKRSARKPKADVESTEPANSDHSDTESIASQKSTASKTSKKSKASEASSSQRSTRQRSQK